jgi:hypothetical protein
MGETNSPSVAHVGYNISPLSRVKLKKIKFNSMEHKNLAGLNLIHVCLYSTKIIRLSYEKKADFS